MKRATLDDKSTEPCPGCEKLADVRLWHDTEFCYQECSGCGFMARAPLDGNFAQIHTELKSPGGSWINGYIWCMKDTLARMKKAKEGDAS